MKTAEIANIMTAAKAQAVQMEKAVTIVVVNSGGVIVALERVGDPGTFTSLVAEGKAVGSAIMGRDSSELAGMVERAPALVNAMTTRLDGRFVALAGGVVLRQDGEIVGAVGVSGAAATEDEEIAKAGSATL
ncbi:MAG: heme-binding protein [Chloroflexi bacterium]|nr:heme-binding protein [Chloroflexota bacterium]